ncbi:MAG: hypothetical protein MI741_19760 [Rhodospirillales bacterium]|nr:hypothetical protein [Rhodospirillales bacterium]
MPFAVILILVVLALIGVLAFLWVMVLRRPSSDLDRGHRDLFPKTPA